MLQLGVLPGHLIDLYDPDDTEPDPDDEFWLPVNDDSKRKGKGKARVEGPAFDGTLLGGGPKKTIAKAKAIESEGDVEAEPEFILPILPLAQPDLNDVLAEDECADGLACQICTFLNLAGVSCCTMCDAAF